MRAWQNDYAMDCKSIYEGLIPSALSNFRSTKQMKKNKLEDWKKHLNSLDNLSADEIKSVVDQMKYEIGNLKFQIMVAKEEGKRKDIQEIVGDANSKMIFKLENRVSELLSEKKEMEEKLERQGKTIQRLYNDAYEIEGCRYVFSDIPNNFIGKTMVDYMKKFINKDSYKMRVRGQYLDTSKLEVGESWKTYEDGQPISKSKCLRIYIDKKKGGK